MNSLLTILLIFFSLSFSNEKEGKQQTKCSDPFIKYRNNEYRVHYIKLSELSRVQLLLGADKSLDAPIEGTEDLSLMESIDVSDPSDPVIKKTHDIVEEEDFFEKFFSELESSVGYGKLSSKDIDVLEGLLLGKTSKEMADEMGVSRQSIEQRHLKIKKRIGKFLIQFGIVKE